MEATTEELVTAQGAEAKKRQRPSATYTLKQMEEMVNKLIELELISPQDAIEIRKIRTKAKNKYIETL